MNTVPVIRSLNRPGIRWLAAAGASVAETCARGRPALVQPLPGGAFLHRHRDGKVVLADVLSRVTPAQQERCTRDIFCFGYTPKAGDTVLDIGAGYGEETLTFSRLVGPAGRVISIEAHPRTYRHLVLMCKYNKLGNVTPLQVAVADAETAVTIGDGNLEEGGYQAARIGKEAGTEVAATTIDSIVAEYGCERVDLLKINIEGAEQLAIRGMEMSVEKIRNVVISCHDFLLKPGTSEQETAWFATYGLVTAFLRKRGFTLAARRVNDPRPWVPFYVYGARC